LIEIEGLRVVFHGDDGRSTYAVDTSWTLIVRRASSRVSIHEAELST
jgi:hypothetical protein